MKSAKELFAYLNEYHEGKHSQKDLQSYVLDEILSIPNEGATGQVKAHIGNFLDHILDKESVPEELEINLRVRFYIAYLIELTREHEKYDTPEARKDKFYLFEFREEVNSIQELLFGPYQEELYNQWKSQEEDDSEIDKSEWDIPLTGDHIEALPPEYLVQGLHPAVFSWHDLLLMEAPLIEIRKSLISILSNQ